MLAKRPDFASRYNANIDHTKLADRLWKSDVFGGPVMDPIGRLENGKKKKRDCGNLAPNLESPNP